MLRMKLSDLTPELLREIIILYDDTVGGRGSQFYDPELHFGDYRKALHEGCLVERRFGSVETPYSKLWIRLEPPRLATEPLISFGFNPCIDPKGGDKEAGEELKEVFEMVIDGFLRRKNLAVTLLQGTH